MESQIAKGLENISKTQGKAISSVPFLRQGPVDEWLLAGGEKLHKDGTLKVEHITSAFSAELYTCADVFVDGIQHIAKVSNRTADFLFDEPALYLATE